MITLTDKDCRILNSELNLNFKRLGKGIKSIFQLYVDYQMNNNKIDPERGLFIPSALLRSISWRHYQTIRESTCVMKGFSSHTEGICDLIVNWTDIFRLAIINVTKNHVIFNSRGRIINKDIVLPAADLANYSQSLNSGRYYHPMQNLSRVHRGMLFKGCDDIDIKAAWPSIFLSSIQSFIINNIDYTIPLTALMPLLNRLTNNDKLLQDIIDADIYLHKARNESPRDRAKAIRSRLFNHKVNENTGIIKPNRRLNCEWYDELANAIYVALIIMGVKDSHLYFSTIEQNIIAETIDVIGKNAVLLNMHDGLILKPNTITQDVMIKVNNIQPYISFKHAII